MAWTLTEYQTRARDVLVDASSPQAWDTATITAGVRAALGELNLADGETWFTINGLDGALETTVPQKLEPVVGLGAAGYAAISRGLDEAEKLRVNGDASRRLSEWGEARLREFRAMLATVYPSYALMIGASAGGAAGGTDAAKTAAEIGLLQAQAELASSQAAHVDGEEGRAAAAAAQAAQDRADEAARLADLRAAEVTPWAAWLDEEGITYPDGYERS